MGRIDYMNHEEAFYDNHIAREPSDDSWRNDNDEEELVSSVAQGDHRFIKLSDFWPGDYFSISTEHY